MFFEDVLDWLKWNWYIVLTGLLILATLSLILDVSGVFGVSMESCVPAEVVDTGFIPGKAGEPARVGISTNGDAIIVPGTSSTPDKHTLILYVTSLDEYVEVTTNIDTLYKASNANFVYYVVTKTKLFGITKTQVSLDAQVCSDI